MKITLAFLFVLLLSGAATAQDLPPDILADQYMLEATQALEKGELQKALRAFQKIEALDIEPPPMFAYFYGKLLVEYGVGPEVWREGQALLKQFVIGAGRKSEYYRPALELLTAAEEKLGRAAEEEAQRQAMAQRRAMAEAGQRRAMAETARRQATLKAQLPQLLAILDQQMVRVQGGTFRMGCQVGFLSSDSDCEEDEKPAHRVEVRSFEISKHEVTNQFWEVVMGKSPGSFQRCPQCSVEQVSWNDIQNFFKALNQTGAQYRLPSEAEWEYAARGGRQSRGYEYAGSDNPDAVAWYNGNSGDKLYPVGQKQANELGLYDMSGNVREWVQDCYNSSYAGAPSDGRAWEQETCYYRVLRGGSWGDLPRDLRSANRVENGSDYRSSLSGFRIARSLP